MLTNLGATVTIAEAARRMRITPNGLRYWIERGRIETVPTPLGRLVVEESLSAFLRERASSVVAA